MSKYDQNVIVLKSGKKIYIDQKEAVGTKTGSLYKNILAITQDEEDDPDHVYGFWHLIPDLVLERVFQHLSIIERYCASQVCQNWYHAFNFPRTWYTFIMYDGLLTKRKYNYYAGWQKLLDHFRANHFLFKLGMNIRTLIFKPMENLFNLYEFLNVCHFCNDRYPGTLSKVHTLRFQFSCHLEQREEELVFGTGGQILEMLKKVMGILTGLKTLELRDLLLDGREGLQLLDEVCIVCCETLKTLVLINVTKLNHTLIHPGTFINLTTLYISPQNIGEDLLELVGTSKIRNMYIVQNKYTEEGRSLDYKSWKKCRKFNPCLRVHLCIEENCKKEIIWQRGAPIRTVLYDTPFSKVTTPVIMNMVEFYKRDIEIFAHKQLPRFHMSHKFHERSDSNLLLIVRQCPNIHTLVIRELISTATVLLLAHTAKNLQYLYVRRNAIILKADWPHNPDWRDEFYQWLCQNARSYEAMEREVSQIMGYRWQPLSDKQFKMLKLNLNESCFYAYNFS